MGAPADNFAWLGGNRVLYSTYTDGRNLFLSEDSGASLARVSEVETGQTDDWLDHVISIHDGHVGIVVGGTSKGFIIYSQLAGQYPPVVLTWSLVG